MFNSITNRGLFSQNFRTIGWISLVYFVGLFFTIPLHILMTLSKDVSKPDGWSSIFSVNDSLFGVMTPIQVLWAFSIPLLMALFQFRYLQVKLAADFMHALPIQRKTMYHHHLIVGSVMLIIPVVLTGLFVALIGSLSGVEDYVSMKAIVTWTFYTIVLNLFLYTLTVFIGMMTGMSVFQAALVYIMLFFPAGITMLSVYNLTYLIYGFSDIHFINQNLAYLVPMISMLESEFKPIQATEITVYLALTVVFYVSSYFLYKSRAIEAASQALAYKILRPIFVYGVTISCMLLGGVYFGETQQQNFSWTIFGYVSASVIGYIVAQMITEKTWRVFRKWKGYFIFVVTASVLFFIVQLDVTGFESKQPAIADVKRAYFSMDGFQLERVTGKTQQDYEVSITSMERNYFYEDKENIEKIMAFHQHVMDHRQDYRKLSTTNERNVWRVYVGYELHNGKYMIRQYEVPKAEYEKVIAALMPSEEHQKNYYPVLRLQDLAKVNRVTFLTNSFGGGSLNLREVYMEEFVSLLQKEVREGTYEELRDERPAWGTIEIGVSGDKVVAFEWKKSFADIDKWLLEHQLLEAARPTASKIEHAYVFKGGEDYHKYYSNPEEIAKLPDAVKVTKPAQIDQLLQVSGGWDDKAEYVVAYFYSGIKDPQIEPILDPAKVPAFVK